MPLPPYADALAETVLLARQRAKEPVPVRSLHVLGATGFDLIMQWGNLERATRCFEGGWRTSNGTTIRVGLGVITWHDGEQAPYTVDGSELRVDRAGETLVGRLEDAGKTLAWDSGDCWERPEAPLKVVLVGPSLPLGGEGKLERVPAEPGVHLHCYKGTYEDFAASAEFTPPDVALLANPGLAAGGTGNFFDWIPALHALPPGTFGVCCGVEPYSAGEFTNDGVFDERVLRAAGFEIASPARRSPHGCFCEGHPESSWMLWSFTLAFRVVVDQPLDTFKWRTYWQARRLRASHACFRFRPPDPELEPEEQEDVRALSATLRAELEKVVARKDLGAGEERELCDELLRAGEANQEKAVELRGRQLAATVATAWRRGGGTSELVATCAGAVAAAEGFAVSDRKRPPAPGQRHELALGAGEIALLCALDEDPGVAAVCLAAVIIFELLVVEALWPVKQPARYKVAEHCVLFILERERLELTSGGASSISARVEQVYADLMPLPPFERLQEQLLLFCKDACVFLGVAEGEEELVARAIVDNMDLRLAAQSEFVQPRKLAASLPETAAVTSV